MLLLMLVMVACRLQVQGFLPHVLLPERTLGSPALWEHGAPSGADPRQGGEQTGEAVASVIHLQIAPQGRKEMGLSFGREDLLDGLADLPVLQPARPSEPHLSDPVCSIHKSRQKKEKQPVVRLLPVAS